MKCYYHNDIDAVAICKNCSKGLCKECAAELDDGIACKDRCEGQVEYINSLINRNIKAISNRKRFLLRSFLFTFLSGLIFIIYGVYNFRGHGFDYFTISVGSVFLLTSLFTVLNAKSLEENKKKTK